MRTITPIIFSIFVSLAITSCGSESVPEEEPADQPEVATPVTIAPVMRGPLQETAELNARSSFLLKTIVNSTTNGYLQQVNVKIGQYVKAGEEMFTIKTKEAEALGNTINVLDSSFRFTGLIHIKSPGSGYISALGYEAGNYVTDGEPLATISNAGSFVFLMELPYELKPYLAKNKSVVLTLPDGSRLNGRIDSQMPVVDPESQTQSIVIKTDAKTRIPENLVAKVTLLKQLKENAIYVPKEAVLSDEMQSRFWVMKLVDSTTAVKLVIERGIETGNRVEILSPAITTADRVLLTGNYGLPDTAKIVIQNQ